jgi:hypothetical protein
MPDHQDDTATTRYTAHLRDALERAFTDRGWPSRLILAAPHTPAEAEALDTFTTAMRLDLPDVRVVVR